MTNKDYQVSSIVTNWYFKKESSNEDIKLVLELQMFDGLIKELLFDLEYLPELFNKFGIGGQLTDPFLNFMHCRVLCLVRPQFEKTPLGTMKNSYKIIAVKDNIHQDWLYLY